MEKTSELQKAKDGVEHLNLLLAEANANILKGKEANDKWYLQKSYDADTRKFLFFCLLNQVPVERAGTLVDYIMKVLTNSTLVRIPAPNITAQMAYEMGIISDLQVAEHLFLADKQVASIAWDPTTIEGWNYNEIIIHLKSILTIFFEKYCTDGSLRLGELNDLQNPVILTQ